MRPTIVALVLLAACSGGNTGVAPVAPLPAAPFASSQTAPAHDNYAARVRDAPDFHDLGRAPRSMQVSLSVMLRYQHQAELDELVQAQSDRSSPYFRRYLTNAQFNAGSGSRRKWTSFSALASVS